MNNVQVSGNLANDPVVRTVPSGKKVCNLLIASERPSLNPDGTRDVDFIPAIIWGELPPLKEVGAS